jgi:hypothetical protein
MVLSFGLAAMRVLLLTIVLLVAHFGAGARSDLDRRIAPIVRPHTFSLAGWEFETLTRGVWPSLFRRAGRGDVDTVLVYFADAGEVGALQSRLDAGRTGPPADTARTQAELDRLRGQREALAGKVQAVIEKQVTDVLRGQGIYSPFPVRLSFPPVNFTLARPPHLLVVSRRDRIESISRTMLRPDISLSDVADIESRVDGLDVSSLVTGIGGLGATYPTFVADDMDLRATIETAVHEWLHQYLAFRPLGFRYVLELTGIAAGRDITALNETLADIAGREIGNLVYEKYYGPSPPGDSDQPVSPFDFNLEMRGIRQQVDSYLSQGMVDQAERYMTERRDYLAGQGYYIRKLNQAYFAFYGSYTDSPASVDPIGADMTQLRSQSGSLKRFLDLASAITGRQALKEAVAGGAGGTR